MDLSSGRKIVESVTWRSGQSWVYSDPDYPTVVVRISGIFKHWKGEIAAYEDRFHVAVECLNDNYANTFFHRGEWIKGDLYIEGLAKAMELLERYGRHGGK